MNGLVSSKRRRADDGDLAALPSFPAIESRASVPLSSASQLQTPLVLESTCTLTANAEAVSSQAESPSSVNTTQQAKKRRLTQKEKDDQRTEKEAKAKARAEKKAQKEAEDELKAEQKAQKEQERRKKAEERDERRRQKEEDQQQKEEEKAKKERTQTRLNSFFAKPKAGETHARQAEIDTVQDSTMPSTSSARDTIGASVGSSPPARKSSTRASQSDYEQFFLPFNLTTHAILAPQNAFLADPVRLEAAQIRLEQLIAREQVAAEATSLKAFKASFPGCDRGNLSDVSMVDIAEWVNDSSDRSFDLSDDKRTVSRNPLDMLKSIPMKYLHFGEDVRPPYYGTYTKPHSGLDGARLARNPFARVRQDADYGYDSEAEWEEPEEGEDLDSDGEEDGDEEVEDDMDGFLDDEEDPQMRRKLISGNLEPVSSGLCWEDVDGVSRLNDEVATVCTDFKDFAMGFLLEQQVQYIDPLSTMYWMPEPILATAAVTGASMESGYSGGMDPPRAPLAQRTMNGLLNTFNTPAPHPPPGSSSKATKAKRLIPTEHLPAFKAEIQGKDLTKIGMIEALKKVFPKLPKDAITNTLSIVATRVGPTEKEKRWVLISS